MADLVLYTNTLPDPLFRLIRTEKVKVNEFDGVISLIPIVESTSDCPLRGLASDSRLTVDSFLSMTHDEKDMEQ